MGYDGDIVDIMGIFYVVGDILGIRKLDIIRKKRQGYKSPTFNDTWGLSEGTTPQCMAASRGSFGMID